MEEKFSTPYIGCLNVVFFVFTGLACGLSYWFAHTLNPFTLFTIGTTGQVVAVTLCSVLAGITGLSILGLWMQSIASRRIDPRLKALFGCMIIALVCLILSYSFTGLLNPIESFRLLKGGRLVALISSIIFFGFSLLKLLFWLTIISRIEKSSKGSFWDVRCRFCHNPVCEITIKTGLPIRCPHCGEWVHSSHWAANGGNPMHRCPGCVQVHERSGLDDILKEWRDRL